MGKIKLNHHSAVVLPYFINEKGQPVYIFERKSPEFKKPFFDGGLNFLGGNWQKGVNKDKSPRGLLYRELNEEFWNIEEPEESLNDLLGQIFVDESSKPLKMKYSDEEYLKEIQEVGNFFKENPDYVQTSVLSVMPPLTNFPLVLANSVFSKELSPSQVKKFKSLLDKFNGKLTTDNLQWGGETVGPK